MPRMAAAPSMGPQAVGLSPTLHCAEAQLYPSDAVTEKLGIPARALDTGQPSFVSFASFSNAD